jgi:hypothetical protein
MSTNGWKRNAEMVFCQTAYFQASTEFKSQNMKNMKKLSSNALVLFFFENRGSCSVQSWEQVTLQLLPVCE